MMSNVSHSPNVVPFSNGVGMYSCVAVIAFLSFLFSDDTELHQLNGRKEPGSCEAMSYDALNVNVLTLCRAPEFE